MVYARPKLSEIMEEKATPYVRPATLPVTRAQTAAEAQTATSIQNNPFYKVFQNKELSPQQQEAEIAKLRVATTDKAQNRESTQLYEQFEEYLQERRKEFALKIVDLIKSPLFNKVKKFYTNMQGGLLEYDESLKPMADLLDGLNSLREKNITLEAFAEVEKDIAEEKRRKGIKTEQEQEAERIVEEIDSKTRQKAHEGENTSWLTGRVKKSSRMALADLTIDLERLETEKTILADKMAKTDAEFSNPLPSGLKPEDIAAKQQLRILVELSDAEHDEREKRLSSAMTNFAKHTDEDTAEALEALEAVGSHFSVLRDTATQMNRTVKILDEGDKKALVASRELFQTFVPAPEALEEGEIPKMVREEKKATVQDHITEAELLSGARLEMMTDLAMQQTSAQGLYEKNRQETLNVKTLHFNGVAGTSERFVTVLGGVKGAILHEASAMTANSLSVLNKKTNSTMAKGIIANAIGMLDRNDRLAETIEQLAEIRQKVADATKVTRKALSDGASIRDEIELNIQSLVDSQKAYLEQAATTQAEAEKIVAERTPMTAQPASDDLFPSIK